MSNEIEIELAGTTGYVLYRVDQYGADFQACFFALNGENKFSTEEYRELYAGLGLRPVKNRIYQLIWHIICRFI